MKLLLILLFGAALAFVGVYLYVRWADERDYPSTRAYLRREA